MLPTHEIFWLIFTKSISTYIHLHFSFLQHQFVFHHCTHSLKNLAKSISYSILKQNISSILFSGKSCGTEIRFEVFNSLHRHLPLRLLTCFWYEIALHFCPLMNHQDLKPEWANFMGLRAFILREKKNYSFMHTYHKNVLLFFISLTLTFIKKPFASAECGFVRGFSVFIILELKSVIHLP